MINYTTSAPLLVQMKLMQMVVDGIDPDIIRQEVENYLEEHGEGNYTEPYVYDRNSIVASTWTIEHNLNRYPQVTLIDVFGHTMDADVEYSSLDMIVVTFAEPTAGMAVLA